MAAHPRRPDDDDDGVLPQVVREVIGQRQWERNKRHAAQEAGMDRSMKVAGTITAWFAAVFLCGLMVIGLMAAWKHWR